LDVGEQDCEVSHEYIETNQYFGCVHFEPKELAKGLRTGMSMAVAGEALQTILKE
jgi:hypothetical protein